REGRRGLPLEGRQERLALLVEDHAERVHGDERAHHRVALRGRGRAQPALEAVRTDGGPRAGADVALRHVGPGVAAGRVALVRARRAEDDGAPRGADGVGPAPDPEALDVGDQRLALAIANTSDRNPRRTSLNCSWRSMGAMWPAPSSTTSRPSGSWSLMAMAD